LESTIFATNLTLLAKIITEINNGLAYKLSQLKILGVQTYQWKVGLEIIA
jgi:hypothetical protein